MPDIGTEIRIFWYALLTGVLNAAAYLWLMTFRRIFAHKLWMLNLEDTCYWFASTIYTFVQIYHTSDGILRWYIGLGILMGATGMIGFAIAFLQVYQRIFDGICEKKRKGIDKSG